jgi:large subunit ribosomal protein L4e
MAKVLDFSGNVVRDVDSPAVFGEAYRPDLIKRAVLAAQSNRLQPCGPSKRAGMRTSAESWGTGRGVSRVPRIKTGRRAARIPQAVGGRRAHPPKPEKNLVEKINKKEHRKAIRSAIAATSNEELVRGRGHRFDIELPIIVVDELEEMNKTKEVQLLLEELNVWDDILRAKRRKTRAGKGKMRGRRYKKKKSILIIPAEDKGIVKAARNLPGVDITPVRSLSAELLAPGTHAGRLTIWSETAIKILGEAYSY